MRVLIATGIFAPEAGGPATYAPQLATELTRLGYNVDVLTYSSEPSHGGDAAYPFTLRRIVRGGKFLNRIRFFFAALKLAQDCDIMYTLDWFAAGLPVAIAAKLAGVPYVVRVGGDYLWEQKYLESGEEPVTLKEFYTRSIHRRLSYRPYFWMISFVLSRAVHVVFNSIDQRELYEQHYGLTSTTTIENPMPHSPGIRRETPTKEFVFWGRFIVMKNLETLIRAFAAAEIPREFTLALIGAGPQKARLESLAERLKVDERVRFENSMPQREVLERVRNARAFILPSWTDIAPNQVYEALAIGLPALVTKENYLSIREQLPETFSPSSAGELTAALELLADEANYARFSERFSSIRFARGWSDVTRAHAAVFASVLGYEISPRRILQIGADRSRLGILYPDSPAAARQRAYAGKFGHLDIIAFSRRTDGASIRAEPNLNIYPTASLSPLLYGLDAFLTAVALPRPDVVSAQDPFETGLAAWLIALLKGAPLHVQVHTDVLAPEYARHSLANRFRVPLAKFVLRRAARIRVVSERTRNSLLRLDLGVPITVLPIFADAQRLRDAKADQKLASRFSAFKTKLLNVGRLEPEKNAALAISAFASAAPENACLIIVGEGSQRAALRLHAEHLGISDRVFFEGLQDAARYYPFADLVLVPSKYEGYGLVIVEALASGVPVLSTDVGVAREAGAIVSSAEHFADSLNVWFEKGPRAGELKGYPYKSFNEYVSAYAADILSCVARQKSQ